MNWEKFMESVREFNNSKSRRMRSVTFTILIMLSYTLGALSIVWIIDTNNEQKLTSEPTLDIPLSLGNNMRRSYTLRTKDGEVDVIEFVSDRNDYCIALITEVTISGAQSAALSCLTEYN